MINNIFKSLAVTSFLTLIVILFGIYQKMDNGRFQISENRVLITKNGKVYLSDPSFGGYYKLNKKYIERIPEFDVLKLEELPQ